MPKTISPASHLRHLCEQAVMNDGTTISLTIKDALNIACDFDEIARMRATAKEKMKRKLEREGAMRTQHSITSKRLGHALYAIIQYKETGDKSLLDYHYGLATREVDETGTRLIPAPELPSGKKALPLAEYEHKGYGNA